MLPPRSQFNKATTAKTTFHLSTRANQENLDTQYNPLLLSIEEKTHSSRKLLFGLQKYL